MPDSTPQPTPNAADPGPSPGPEFIRIRWIKAIDKEPIGAVEWAERRRAAGLVRDGYAVLADAD